MTLRALNQFYASPSLDSDIKSYSLGFVWTINHTDYALFSEAWGFFSPKKTPHIVTQGQ